MAKKTVQPSMVAASECPALEHSVQMEQGVEWCRGMAKETQNPVYAWMALMFRWWGRSQRVSNGEEIDDLAIPGWCALYFGDCAQTLSFLADGIDFRIEPSLDGREPTLLSVEDSMKLVSEALALSGGTNAFRRFRSDQNNATAFRRLKELQANGLSYEAALKQLAEEVGQEQSVVRKKTTLARRISGATGKKT
jgi:hypothetical protein